MKSIVAASLVGIMTVSFGFMGLSKQKKEVNTEHMNMSIEEEDSSFSVKPVESILNDLVHDVISRKKRKELRKMQIGDSRSVEKLLTDFSGEHFGLSDELKDIYTNFKKSQDDIYIKSLGAKDILRLYIKSLIDGDVRTEYYLLDTSANKMSLHSYINLEEKSKPNLKIIEDKFYPALEGKFLETNEGFGVLKYENPDFHFIDFVKADSGAWKIAFNLSKGADNN